MLDILNKAEKALPGLLEDEDGWTGLYADSETPHLRRLWRQWGEHRLYLHCFEPCVSGDLGFLHPHPWKSVIRILKGHYEMDLGYGTDPAGQPITLSHIILPPNSVYEMSHPHGFHSVRTGSHEQTWTFMVAGPVIWPNNRIEGNGPSRQLSPRERHGMFKFYRDAYTRY